MPPEEEPSNESEATFFRVCSTCRKPIAFGALNDLTGVWSSCFMLLFVIVVTCLAWMHFSIRRLERAAAASTLSYAAE